MADSGTVTAAWAEARRLRRETAAPARPEGEERRARHVAIIMDGNGRWAKARGLPRIAGHRRGADAVRDVIKACPDLGVEILTLFAFSTENWRRPREEVLGLWDLFRRYFAREAETLRREGVRVRFLGEPDALPADLQAMMRELSASTAENDRMTLVVAINYGARAELAAAARRLAAQAARGDIDPEAIDEAAFAAELQTRDLPDPDLVIRTSGEQRLSNFLLWQSAYSELAFATCPWPEFTRGAFEAALADFTGRERRFGAAGP